VLWDAKHVQANKVKVKIKAIERNNKKQEVIFSFKKISFFSFSGKSLKNKKINNKCAHIRTHSGTL
jgi:hypothetical protein